MSGIRIDLRPVGNNNMFEARRGNKLICTSPRPVLESARLLAHHAIDNPELMIYAYREGETDWCMRGRIVDLARISVNDRKGKTIRAEKKRARPWD